LIHKELGIAEKGDYGNLHTNSGLKACYEGGILSLVVGPILTEILTDFDDRLWGIGGCIDCNTKATTKLALTTSCAIEVD
jgi:hypothetical protein